MFFEECIWRGIKRKGTPFCHSTPSTLPMGSGGRGRRDQNLKTVTSLISAHLPAFPIQLNKGKQLVTKEFGWTSRDN